MKFSQLLKYIPECKGESQLKQDKYDIFTSKYIILFYSSSSKKSSLVTMDQKIVIKSHLNILTYIISWGIIADNIIPFIDRSVYTAKKLKNPSRVNHI